MNVGATQVSVQWDEIQRLVRERNDQRQQLLTKQYQNGSGMQQSATGSEAPDTQRADRVVFTKNGKLQQNYIPKGTLFDRVG